MDTILSSTEAPAGYMGCKVKYLPSLGYDLSLGTSLATLVSMVTLFLICEENMSNLMYYFLVI